MNQAIISLNEVIERVTRNRDNEMESLEVYERQVKQFQESIKERNKALIDLNQSLILLQEEEANSEEEFRNEVFKQNLIEFAKTLGLDAEENLRKLEKYLSENGYSDITSLLNTIMIEYAEQISICPKTNDGNKYFGFFNWDTLVLSRPTEYGVNYVVVQSAVVIIHYLLELDFIVTSDDLRDQPLFEETISIMTNKDYTMTNKD